MFNYLISIIIPVYNAEKYIKKAFNSILNQSIGFNNLEIIFVDDASSDNSKNIIQGLVNNYDNVKLFCTDKNSGYAGKPRNIGIEHASAEYLMFLDSDDILYNDACEVLYNEITLNNVDIVSGNFVIIEERGEIKNNWGRLDLKEGKLYINTVDECINIFRVPVAITSKLFKKSVIIENELSFLEDVPAQDYVFGIDYLLKSKGILFIDFPVYKYYVRNESEHKSVSSKRDKNLFLGYIKSFTLAYNILNEFNPNYSWLAPLNLHYWTQQFILSGLTFEEKLDVLKAAEFLFEKFHESDELIPQTRFESFFNCVYEKNYYYAIQVSESIASTYNKSFKLSIILPVFNVEHYLNRAFDSILNQSIGFDNLEVIFVDDCSTDNSYEIIKNYATSYENVKVYSLESNSGNCGKPRNLGLFCATSDYVMVFDPDDVLFFDACEILYNEMFNNSVDVVSGNYVKVNEYGETRNDWSSLNLTNGKVHIQNIKENPNILTIPPAVWTKLFKRKIILENNMSFLVDVPAEDLDFVSRYMLKAEGIIYIDKPIVKYMVRDDSITSIKDKSLFYGYLTVYTRIYDLFKDYDKNLTWLAPLHLYFFAKQFVLCDLSYEDKYEILEKAEFLFAEFNKSDKLKPIRQYQRFFELIQDKNYSEAINEAKNVKKYLVDEFQKDNEIIINKDIFMLFYGFDTNIGGLAKAVFNRANALAKKGYGVTLLNVDSFYQLDIFNDFKNFNFIEENFRKIGVLHNDVKLINVFNYYRDKNTVDFKSKFIKNLDNSLFDITSNFSHDFFIYGDYLVNRIVSRDNAIILNYYDLNMFNFDDFILKDKLNDIQFLEYFGDLSNKYKIKYEKYIEGSLAIETFLKDKIVNFYTCDGFKYFSITVENYKEIFTLFERDSFCSIVFNNLFEFNDHFVTEICLNTKEKPFLINDCSGIIPDIQNISSDIAYKIGNIHSNPYKGNRPHYGSPRREIAALNNIEDMDAIVTLTNSQKEDFIKEFNYDKFYDIPNFICKDDLDDIFESKQEVNPNKISIFSRISPEKNISDAIKAFKIVSESYDDVFLNIYGRALNEKEKNELIYLKNLIQELDISDKVHFKGHTDNVNKEMSNSLVTLFTSNFEGMGLVVIESMANSTPVISYDLYYGPRDIITHEKEGFLVEQYNVDSLAESLSNVLNNSYNLEIIGITARNKVLKDFSEDVVIFKWEKLFDNVSASADLKKNNYLNQLKKTSINQKSKINKNIDNIISLTSNFKSNIPLLKEEIVSLNEIYFNMMEQNKRLR